MRSHSNSIKELLYPPRRGAASNYPRHLAKGGWHDSCRRSTIMLETRDNRVKLHRGYASSPFDEGTKGRLYFLPPNQRPRAVDAIVGRVEQHSVVFHFVGPAVAPPPIDPQAQCVRLSGSWLWASAIQRSS